MISNKIDSLESAYQILANTGMTAVSVVDVLGILAIKNHISLAHSHYWMMSGTSESDYGIFTRLFSVVNVNLYVKKQHVRI